MAPQLAVEHPQHVAVELGGHALGVVVGGDQAAGVLDQVGAEQQRVARAPARRPASARNRARLGGLEVADGAAEEGDEPAAAGGQRAEVVVEVADDAVDLDARVALGEHRRRPAQDALGHVEGDEAAQPPAWRRTASRRRRVLSDVPEPSSMTVSACRPRRRSSAATAREDLPLAPVG